MKAGLFYMFPETEMIVVILEIAKGWVLAESQLLYLDSRAAES